MKKFVVVLIKGCSQNKKGKLYINKPAENFINAPTLD
jgi:hypothetical protein